MPSLDKVAREEDLRNSLLATVDLLKRRRADKISEGLVDAYIALNWLEWNGGGLRLTTVGHNICNQLTSRMG